MEQHLYNPQIVREIVTKPPRNLNNIQAELLFVEDTYLFHYKENDSDIYKYLSPESLQTAFSNQPLDSGWIEPGILRHGTHYQGRWAVMFIPSQRYSLNFEEYSLNIPLPSFVFMGMNRHYWLWAIPTKTFDSKAQVFHAPLPNVNTSPIGKICWGNNQPPLANAQTLKVAWELFISSQFTNHYTNSKSKQFGINIIEKLKEVHLRSQRSKRYSYPISDLFSIGQDETVESLVQAVLQSQLT